MWPLLTMAAAVSAEVHVAEVGRRSLEKLVSVCVEAGGLRREPGPGGKGQRLAVTDAGKLAAAVRAAPDLPTWPLSDALVGGWNRADPAERPVFVELLAAVGDKTGDDRSRGLAAYFRSVKDAEQRRYQEAITGYLEAA